MKALELYSLEDITVDILLSHIEDAPKDIKDWMYRGYWNKGSGYQFENMVDQKIRSAVFDVKAWRGNPTPLMRGIPRKEIKEPFGVHWTVSLDRAIEFAGGYNFLRTNVSLDDVNWLHTVMRRIAWKYEYEISLISNTKVFAEIVNATTGDVINTVTGRV